MRNLIITTAIALITSPLSTLAYTNTSTTNLCHFANASIGGVRLSSLRSAVSNDNYGSLSSNGSNSKCNSLYNVIQKGKFAGTATQEQSSDSSYDYYTIESQYCDTPTVDNPLTQKDIDHLIEYNNLLVQAATGCQAAYYKVQILKTLSSQNSSS